MSVRDGQELTLTGSATKLASSIMGPWKKLFEISNIKTHSPVLIPAEPHSLLAPYARRHGQG